MVTQMDCNIHRSSRAEFRAPKLFRGAFADRTGPGVETPSVLTVERVSCDCISFRSWRTLSMSNLGAVRGVDALVGPGVDES
jgi:hypothetical protein